MYKVVHTLTGAAGNGLTGEINCTWKQMSHRVMFADRCWSKILLIDENSLGITASFAGYSKELIQIAYVYI